MNLIFTSDWHVRYDQPINRKDNFLELQKEALIEIASIAKKNKATIIVGGDIFHRAKPINPQYLEILLYEIFKYCEIYFLPGQHDLIDHNIENFDNGSIGILNRFSNWKFHQEAVFNDKVIIWNFGWNQEIEETGCLDDLKIAVFHKFISILPLPPWMKDKGISSKELCNKYPSYNIFVSGDNHSGFVYKNEKTNQLVFNPGCLTRQKISEKDYKPRCYLFNTDTKQYKIIYLLDNNPDVFRKDTKEKEKLERESRIDSFIELAGKKKKITWDYEENLKQFCLENKIKKDISDEINIILQEYYEEKN
ncbi:MAG: metallophosphoesterase [Planctomycetota bacterium]|jgi:hypothetical protein